MDLSRGATLVLLGVVLFAATMAVGAATAPSRDVGGVAAPTTTAVPTATGTDTGPGTTTGSTTGTPTPTTTLADRAQTLVGMQGTWATKGSVFRLDGSTIAWKTNADPDSATYADSYFDVTKLPNGTVLAAFIDSGYQRCGPYDAPCDRTGYRIIDPDAAGGRAVLSEYSFPVRSATNSEVHDVERLGPGRFVMTDMDRERIFIEENGTVTWQWNASSFYEAPPDPTRRDWLHINDVDTIGEGRFLVSVRNANQLVVVQRGQGVVEVVNADDGGSDASCKKRHSQLGDFDGDGDVRCGDPSVINHQHNPQWLGSGAVLVADSDNDRVVELHRTDDGDWEPAWTLEKAGGIPLHWPRDADRLPNGNTLVTDTLNKRVFEISPDGTVVWSYGTNRIPYEADRLPYGEIVGGSGAGTATPAGTDTDANGTETSPGGDTGPGGTDTASGANTPLPTASGESIDGGDSGGTVPVLSTVVVALRGQFGWVPFWFGEFHLALTVVSVGLVFGGGLDYWLARREGSLRAVLRRD